MTGELKTYTLDEVAEALRVTRRTLYSYIKTGQLKATKIGRFWRVSEDSLRTFIAKGARTE